ncbi:MAG TPA: hypothetical protein VHK91_11550 [Flavisolibacter sp.]|jgi:peptidoglycan/LPS O-acetylase OafA/YrhL|nr:hypothetical protein [Flavisolibacter sp.]
MEQMNFHKQKLYALIAAAIGVIAMFLPWWKVSFGGFISTSVNGMHDLGILAFIGFIAAGALTYMGDKTKPFAGQNKLIVAGCFGGAALFTLIQYLQQTSFTAFGMWLSLVAGIGGALIVYVLKPEQLENKPLMP